LGGISGALLLIFTPAAGFSYVVPWLVLLATAAFAASSRLRVRKMSSSRRRATLAFPSLFLIATYGGYFNGGLGILLLAHDTAFGEQSMLRAQAKKNLLSAILTGVAVMLYAAGGQVRWLEAAIVTTGAILGGHFGARAAAQLRVGALRMLIIAVGTILSVALFIQAYAHTHQL
jgi:uncharacterized membrane protein YfcA